MPASRYRRVNPFKLNAYDQVGDLHFDVRQKNHIIWKDREELVERLDRRIRATVLPVGWR